MSSCDLCQPSPHSILWQDDFCRVVLLNDVDYPAYCRVELIAHVKEMTDLAPLSQHRLMNMVFAVEAAMREVINPDKINLASLGNKTPHLHWHIIPRYADDRHFPNSHWGEIVRSGEITDGQKANIHKPSRASLQLLQDKIKVYIECAL